MFAFSRVYKPGSSAFRLFCVVMVLLVYDALRLFFDAAIDQYVGASM